MPSKTERRNKKLLDNPKSKLKQLFRTKMLIGNGIVVIPIKRVKYSATIVVDIQS